MSTPEDASATQQPADSRNIDKEVSSAVKSITTDEEGNYVFPKDVELSDELKFAATAEKRRRDTQTSYTVGQQTNSTLEAENLALREQLGKLTTVTLSVEDKERLDTLKYEDPDSWRTEMDKLEREAKGKSKEALEELTGNASSAAGQKFELKRREQVLKEFNESAEVVITEELITNEVPPRITKKLADGKISFDEFLDEVATYVKTGKVVHNEETLNQPNLGKISGSEAPTDTKPVESFTTSYEKTIF